MEIYFIIYDGIRWFFSYSSPNEYGMLTVKDVEADCEGLCLIDDMNFNEKVDEAIKTMLGYLEN